MKSWLQHVIELLALVGVLALSFLIHRYFEISLWIACVMASVACLYFVRQDRSWSPRVTLALSFAVMGLGGSLTTHVVNPPECDSIDPDPSSYAAPKYWLLDTFGVGHRVETLVGKRAMLVLRRAAPVGGTIGRPRVSKVLVEPAEQCSWTVAEIFPDDDLDWQSFGHRFDTIGTLVFRRALGMVRGSFERQGAAAYTMDAERWAHLHGPGSSTCIACFLSGERSECPSVELSAGETTEALPECMKEEDLP